MKLPTTNNILSSNVKSSSYIALVKLPRFMPEHFGYDMSDMSTLYVSSARMF